MSVTYAGAESVILNHEMWMLQHYFLREEVDCSAKKKKFQMLFDLRTPFLMDGQAEKIATQLEGKEIKARKRKREHKKIVPQDDDEERHIQEVFAALHLRSEYKEMFSYVPSSDDFRQNNSVIREMRKR